MKGEISALIIIATLIFAAVFLAHAQKQMAIPRIGILRAGTLPNANLELFLSALRDLGYVEGNNITIERRFAAGK
jgi:hypothetical protein